MTTNFTPNSQKQSREIDLQTLNIKNTRQQLYDDSQHDPSSDIQRPPLSEPVNPKLQSLSDEPNTMNEPNLPLYASRPSSANASDPSQLGNQPQNRRLHYSENNPTGQNRIAPSENIGTQNIRGNQGETYESCQECYGRCYGCLFSYICCCCCTSAYRVVPQGFTGVVQRFTKFYKLLAPGMHYLNPEIDSLTLVDKRERVIVLPSQVIVTKDNVTLNVDAVLFYKVVESTKSLFSVQNLQLSIIDLSTTGLRNIVGAMTMQGVLENRDHLAEGIQAQLAEPARKWGCIITRVLIQEILLPLDLRAQMGAGAVAKRVAEGKVITAQADVQSAKMMREAADYMNSDAAMQIRYVQTLEQLSKIDNAKLVFWPATFSQLGTIDEDGVSEEGARLLMN